MVDDYVIAIEDVFIDVIFAHNAEPIPNVYTNIRKNYISEYNTYIQCADMAATKPPMVCATIAFDVSSR